MIRREETMVKGLLEVRKNGINLITGIEGIHNKINAICDGGFSRTKAVLIIGYDMVSTSLDLRINNEFK